MNKFIIIISVLASLLNTDKVMGQRRLEVGTVVKITGLDFFDENYPNREKLINKKGVVSTKELVNMGGAKNGVYNPSGPYGGEITIEGEKYNFLSVSLEVTTKTIEATPDVNNNSKLSEDIITIVKAYFQDFKEFIDESSYEDNNIKSFASKYKITGSYGKNSIYHYKSSDQWSFSAMIDINKISLSNLKQTLGNISFDFGSLKILEQGSNKDWTYYIPQTKNGTNPKLKELTISLFLDTESFIRFTIERNAANSSK